MTQLMGTIMADHLTGQPLTGRASHGRPARNGGSRT